MAREVAVEVAVVLRGELANADELAGLAAALDGLLTARYPASYNGPRVRISAETPEPRRG